MNFLFLVGAPKCGTTSLANYLATHQKIYLPSIKEPGFFRTDAVRLVINAYFPEHYSESPKDSPRNCISAYLDLFKEAKENQWVIDASTDYFSDDGAARRIKEFAGDHNVKVCCVLRDPVTRAFSEYRHTLRDGLEPLDFRGSLLAETDRQSRNYQPLFFHAYRSKYFESVMRFRKEFGSDFTILDYAALEDVSGLAEIMATFLDIEAKSFGEMPRLNVSAVQMSHPLRVLAAKILRPIASGNRRARLDSFLRVSHSRNRQSGKMTFEDTRLLIDILEEDIRQCVADPEIPTDHWECIRWL